MNEWMFCTADDGGDIKSMDGLPLESSVSVQELCREHGWEIEHSHFVILDETWRLILSRSMPNVRVNSVVVDNATADLRGLSAQLANMDRLVRQP